MHGLRHCSHGTAAMRLPSQALLLALLLAAAAPPPLAAAAAAPSAAASRGGAAASSLLAALGSAPDLSIIHGLVTSTLRITEQDVARVPLVLLAPTNQAVDAFCRSMGLSVAQLQRRPELVDTLVSYHMLPLVKPGVISARVSANQARPTRARTVNPGYTLRFWQQSLPGSNGSRVTVQDAQGNTATVQQPGIAGGSKAMVYRIDRVLLNGDVFTSPAAALQYYKRFSRLLALLNDAGMAAALQQGAGFNATLLAPRNSVLQAAAPQLARLPAGGISDVLRLHVIRGYHAVPTGLAPRTPYATLLKDHSVSVEYHWDTAAEPGTNKTTRVLRASVLPEGGVAVPMVLINVFAAAGVIHGIKGLLLPKSMRAATAATATAAPMVAAPAPVLPPAQPAVAAPAKRGSALTITLPQLGLKPAVSVTVSLGRRHMLTAQQQATAAESGHGGSRRLAAVARGGGGGFRGGGGMPAAFDDRRADDSTFRAPSYAAYTPPMVPRVDDTTRLPQDDIDRNAVVNNAAAAVDDDSARADDRAVSNTAYGLAVGARAGADAAESAGWGGADAYQPAALPADDYADTAVPVPAPTYVTTPVATDYEDVPVPVPVPQPVPQPIDYDVPTPVPVPTPVLAAPAPQPLAAPAPAPAAPAPSPEPAAPVPAVPAPAPSSDYADAAGATPNAGSSTAGGTTEGGCLNCGTGTTSYSDELLAQMGAD